MTQALSMVSLVAPLADAARALAAAALVLALPGYLVLSLADTARRLSFERIVGSMAGSLACTILVGVLLNRSPWGLTSTAWWFAIGLPGALCLGALAVSHMRRGGFRWRRPRVSQSAAIHAAMIVLAVALAGAALALARQGAETHREYAYTNVWILPEGGPDPTSVVVGIGNEEQAERLYDLEITANGATVLNLAGIRIEDGGQFVRSVPVPRDMSSEDMIVARVFLSGRSDLVLPPSLAAAGGG
jgi:uncharacterized membrane protein